MDEHATRPPRADPCHPYPPRDLGLWGERLAARHLTAEGWRIVARGERWGRREIDLVARRGSLVAFVEVKTRSGSGFGDPAEAVTWRKRREIEAVALRYLARERMPDVDIRFDVIAIQTDGRRRVKVFEHIEDAWRPGW